MTEKILNNNQVVVAGEIVSDFRFSHEIFGEGFYMVDLVVSRLSDAHDVIPLMVSDRLFDVEKSHIGEKVLAKGQFRSYNKHEENKNRLILSVFVREIEVIDAVDDKENKPNQIYLDGYICKEPIYRMTPLGREIADLLLAVNRPYGKSDYIPCICWGRNARFASAFEVGEHVQVMGRIQSREYMKKLDEEQFDQVFVYDNQMHGLLVEMTGMTRLYKAWKELNYGNIVTGFSLSTDKKRVLERQYPIHKELVDACREKNKEKICHVLSEHYMRTIRRLLKEQGLSEEDSGFSFDFLV